MSLLSLSDVLGRARRRGGYAIGLVCLGWEDARAYAHAGAATGVPVILSVGPGARRNMPLRVWGAMFDVLKREADIVSHLDHGRGVDDAEEALAAGFSSVMVDASAEPLAANIALTRAVTAKARAVGASVEAEIGVVGYANGDASQSTDPTEARKFAEAVDIDALAVSVGNVHLQTSAEAQIDFGRAAEIAEGVDCPLVLHGGSGVPRADRARLAREHGFVKINIGTEFRQEYGRVLRQTLEDPDLFDRNTILQGTARQLQTFAEERLLDAWNAR
ncbi:MAG: class II fructose-bisphosphate aldolase [Shimia sp.]